MHMSIKPFVRRVVRDSKLLFLLSVLCVLFNTGCSHIQDVVSPDQKGRSRYLSGPGIDIEIQNLNEYSTNQEKVIEELIRLAGLNSPPTTDWKPVVNAGVVYVDKQCERYIDAIFWFNRYKKAAGNQVGLVGTATTGVMGILQAAAKEIAVTAVAFGLAAESINNIGNTILYQLEPSGIRRILSRSQQSYKSAVAGTTYSNRTSAIAAVNGYLALCLPSTLETEINNAVSNAEFETITEVGGANTVPIVRQAPAIAERVSVGEFDVAGRTLKNFLLRPSSESEKKENLARYQACARQANISNLPKPATFISSPALAEQRVKVAKCLKLL